MALREDMVTAIGFVLRLRIGKRLQRALGVREATDARILAEQIVAHLERCRFRFTQDFPSTSHRTPGAASDEVNPPPGR
jgi:hypothetical protein